MERRFDSKVLLAALLALAAWSGAVVRGGFAYDDREAIFENPAVAGELPWTELFLRDYWHHLGDAGHYRPVAALALRIDHGIWGENAAGYHATNALLHALVVALAAAALLRLPRGAALYPGVLVFAAHPVLADSVAWISGRTSMLSCLGGCLALYGVVRARGALAIGAAAGAGILLGLCAKEDAVVFALPCLLVAYVAGSRAKTVACTGGVAAAVAVYAVLRFLALGEVVPSAPHAMLAGAPLVERLAFGGRALLEGMRLLVLPLDYPPNYRAVEGFATASPPRAFPLVGWLPWLALAGAGAWLAYRNRSLAAASAFLAAIAILPVLQLVPAGEIFAPRFLYLPLLFGAPALGAGLRRLPPAVLGVLCAGLVALAWERAGVYADRASYHEEVLRFAPDDAGAWNSLGLAREEAGQREEARISFGEAVKRRPDHSRAWNNLARLALEDGDLDAAERGFRRAVAAEPTNALARCNLGSLLLRKDDPAGAEASYRAATEVAPGLGAAWRGLGNALERQGRDDDARAALERALDLDPGDAAARKLLDRLP